MSKYIYLGVGTLVGGYARVFLAGVAQQLLGSSFAFGTLFVNLLGCFVIGLVSALPDSYLLLGSEGKWLLMTGFCGAFTTFSAFMLETGEFFEKGNSLYAWLNILLSILLGFLFYRLGVLAAKLVV